MKFCIILYFLFQIKKLLLHSTKSFMNENKQNKHNNKTNLFVHSELLVNESLSLPEKEIFSFNGAFAS